MTDISATALVNQMQSLSKNMQAEAHTASAFGQIMHEAIGHVNALSQQADSLKTNFEKGDPAVSLVDAIVASQKENLAMQTVVTVRNKAVTAYQELMNMQV